MEARLMNGAGNRFILADVRGQAARFNLSREAVRAMAHDPHFDQLLVLEDSDSADAFMRIWNADGDEVGACGNGTRAAAWAMMQAHGSRQVSIGTAGGLLAGGIAGIGPDDFAAGIAGHWHVVVGNHLDPAGRYALAYRHVGCDDVADGVVGR